MVPTCLSCLSNERLVLGAKSGELLLLSLPSLELSLHIEAGEALRGPRAMRKHVFCSKYQGSGPAFPGGHHGPVLSLASRNGKFVSVGADCLANARNSSGESEFTLISKAAPVSVVFSDQNIVFADGKVLRVFDNSMEITTLYGPTSEVGSVCSVFGQNAVLCASDDRSLRYFDLHEFSQLTYANDGPLECCAAVSPAVFLAGGPEGIFLYLKDKRDPASRALEGVPVNCMSCCPGYNLVCAGFRGGIAILRVDGDRLVELQRVECKGFVNDVACFIRESELMLAACGGRERPNDRFDVLREQPWVSLWSLAPVDPLPVQRKRNRFSV